jgi:hypothetical protein
MTKTQYPPLTIGLPDGTASTLTVDTITPGRAVVRSTVPGQPDETEVFERRCGGKIRGEPFGVVAWRHACSDSGAKMSLADWRVRQWLDSLTSEVA